MANLIDHIGAIHICVTDPKKSYIVGASDAANKEFQDSFGDFGPMPKEIRDKCTPEAHDVLVKAGMKRFVCENYNDILKVKGMPGCILADENGKEVTNQVTALMYEYHTGKISKEEVVGKVRDICLDMRVYQSQSRHTTGYDKKDNLQILGQLYELFQKKNVTNAVAACYEKGEELARQNGAGDRDDWLYYDADYYYAAEEMRGLIQQAISSVAGEWETDVPDFEELERNTLYTLDGKMDFNSVWNWRALNRYCGTISDFNEAPPEGFSFFFQEDKYQAQEGLSPLERQKGAIRIAFGNKIWEVDVPFNNSLVFGAVQEKFNAGELFRDYVGQGEADARLLSFLGKFHVFTSAYGHNMDW
ncbi:hypothetical protein V1226_17365 [Lachnospiraceae bacterium JLR.KK009]|nr:hypothetical protein C810_03167 [Lachnospiraceae bacterium A2]MCI8706503.1 hypothetical protein [Lachnospiraceae bacterium]